MERIKTVQGFVPLDLSDTTIFNYAPAELIEERDLADRYLNKLVEPHLESLDSELEFALKRVETIKQTIEITHLKKQKCVENISLIKEKLGEVTAEFIRKRDEAERQQQLTRSRERLLQRETKLLQELAQIEEKLRGEND